MAYLAEAFERAEHPDVQRAVVDATAGQTATAAAAFLGRVLRDEAKLENGRSHELGKSAVLRLEKMGPTGVAELRSLATSGAVQDKQVKGWVYRALEDGE